MLYRGAQYDRLYLRYANVKKAALLSSLMTLSAVGLAPTCALADNPAPDPDSIVTVQLENDSASIPGTDRYYTAGQRLSYVSPTGVVPDFVAQLGREFFGEGTQRFELDLQQKIYTPKDTQIYNPDPHDRPYGGDLTTRFTLIQDTDSTRSMAGISVGVVGPWALGQSVQNGFHEIIGQTPNRGWKYQLKNEPTLDIYGGRIWRETLFTTDGLQFQALPQLTAQAGNTEIYGQGGMIVRLGQGLDSDFGPAIIQPSLSGTDAYTPTRPLAWYVFGGALGRFVAHDLLIQGNTYRSSRSVGLTHWQGSLVCGVGAIYHGVRLTASEVFQTPQFHGSAPAFQYGSIALSVRF